jgi:hypothetical protein
MATAGSLELYYSLMKWLRTFPTSQTTEETADVTDGVDMAKVILEKKSAVWIATSILWIRIANMIIRLH